MPEELRKSRKRRTTAAALLFVALAAALSVGMALCVRYGYRLMQERWLKSDSGKMYTPGGAAKKVLEKIKE